MTLDLYTWLKALHVAAAMIFVGGVLAAALFLRMIGPGHADLVRRVRRWDQLVTTPAMLLVWALGLALALMGGWFRDGWLIAKLVFVVALSGAHGVQSAKLRRMSGCLPAPPTSGLVAPLIVGAAIAIAVLVVVKPV